MAEEAPKKDTRLVKCPKCEQKLQKCDSVLHKKRYYHKECYEEYNKDAQDYKDLIETICRVFNLKAPSPQITMQLKKYREDFNFTNKGMELTLRYYYDVLDNKAELKYGIYIIPREYGNATENYKHRMKIAQGVTDEDIHKVNKRVVKVSPKSKRREIKQIDIESI